MEKKKERRTENGLSLDKLETILSKLLTEKHGFEVIVTCTSEKEVKENDDQEVKKPNKT